MFYIPRQSILVQAFIAALFLTLATPNAQAVPAVHERLIIVDPLASSFSEISLGFRSSFGFDPAIQGNTLVLSAPATSLFPVGSSFGYVNRPVTGYSLSSGDAVFQLEEIKVGSYLGFSDNILIATGVDNDNYPTGPTKGVDVTTKELLWTIDAYAVRIAVTGDRVVIKDRKFFGPHHVSVYDLHTGNFLVTLSDGPGTGTFDEFAVGDGLAALSTDISGAASVGIYDVVTGDWLRNLAITEDTSIVHMRADGNNALLGGRHVYDLSTGQFLRDLAWPDSLTTVSGVAIDGHLAVVAGDGQVYVFDVTTGDLAVELARSDGTPLTAGGLGLEIDGTTVAVRSSVSVFAEYDQAFFPAGAVFVFDIPEPTSVAIFALSSWILLRARAYRPHLNR